MRKTLYISDAENGPTRYLLRIEDADDLRPSIGVARRTNPADGRTMYGWHHFRAPRLCMNALLRLLMGRADWHRPSHGRGAD